MTEPRQTATALDMASLILSVMILGFGAWIALAGPEGLMPVHFNIRGEADDWAGRETVGGLVLALGALNLLLCAGMGHFARKADDPARARALRFAQLVSLISLTCVSLFAASLSLSGATSINTALPMAAMGVLFLAIGAFMGRVGPNPFVGVRTPWAFKSKLAWERSNRLAGRLFLLIGLFALVTAPFAPQPVGMTALIVAILLAAAASVFESWRVWRSDPDRQPF